MQERQLWQRILCGFEGIGVHVQKGRRDEAEIDPEREKTMACREKVKGRITT